VIGVTKAKSVPRLRCLGKIIYLFDYLDFLPLRQRLAMGVARRRCKKNRHRLQQDWLALGRLLAANSDLSSFRG
jgi:hypothetical protein